MLAYVAEKGDEIDAAEPVVVVGEDRRPRALEVDEPRDLPLEARRPLVDHLDGIERALAGLAAGIPDEAGTAADEDDRPVPGELHTPEGQERQQAADVEAVGRRIEPHVDRPRPGIE